MSRWFNFGWREAISAKLNSQASSNQSLHTKANKIMATLKELQDAQSAEDVKITDLITVMQSTQTSLASAAATIEDLKAQIAAGQGISPADLNDLKADMEKQAAAIGAVLPGSVVPAPAPAPAAPAPVEADPNAPAPAIDPNNPVANP
jgi:hypothetical protein